MNRIFPTVLPARRALSLLPFLALGACAGGTGDSPAEQAVRKGLSPEEILLAKTPPTYAVGDRYSFDNPAVTWEVTAIKGDEVMWRSDAGEKQITSANPLLPALAWESAERGSGRRLISDQNGGLFPLEVGASLTFKSTVSSDKPPYAWEYDWSCVVLGEAFVPSPVGESHAFEVQCGRDRSDELTFYYAPTIGHYVQMRIAAETGEETPEAEAAIVRNLTAFERRAALDGAAQIVSSSGVADGPVFEASDGAAPEAPQELEDARAATGRIVNAEPPPPAVTVDPAGQPGRAPLPNSVAAAVQSLQAARPQPSAGAPQPLTQGAATTVRSGSAAPASGMAVHLASYRDPANPDRGWRDLSQRYSGVLGGLQPIVQRVDLGARGVFYRLHAGPVASADQASDICRRLQERGAYCKAVKL
ncbi:MAG: SPOR domain-containing protein [Alphaproteobacteria bacterium]|nr:SPOR domain-containing protein [Alphaproteobacteria bacterium]